MKKIALFILTCISIYSYASERVELSEIEYYLSGEGKPLLMVIGGIHGDEISGIEKIRELEKRTLSKGSLLLIPEANREAVKNGNRTEYYMEDLNRAFFYRKDEKTFKITKEIIGVIEKYKPDMILDFHESYYNYDESRDPDFYIGNTVIFQQNTMDNHFELVFQLIEEGFIPLTGAPEGSFNREISQRLNIPVITVEVSREDTIEVRKRKYESVFNRTLKYLGME